MRAHGTAVYGLRTASGLHDRAHVPDVPEPGHDTFAEHSSGHDTGVGPSSRAPPGGRAHTGVARAASARGRAASGHEGVHTGVVRAASSKSGHEHHDQVPPRLNSHLISNPL